MTREEELEYLDSLVAKGCEELTRTLEIIMHATIARKDTTRLVEAYHRFAASLAPFIEKRNRLKRETDKRLS